MFKSTFCNIPEEIKELSICKYQKKKDLIFFTWKYSSKLIYRFNIIPVKIPADFFAEIDKTILIFSYKCKEARTAKPALKTEQSWELSGLNLPESGFYNIEVSIWFQ